ncbi:MAG: hypothetical protein EZS28_001323 [Streblomastix strix]|uniref:Uncharacterized protein n=1 Tax=Streblomastix strix TaxID=222440 RepID=A0A5J4X7J9_9EUKA|nr:MAG: hypothetical protein EZS28_001323 [Streblomastix strix]
MEKKQESKCKELILLFENKLDDEQRKLAVEAGISDALLKIVPSRNCSTFIHAFYVLTYPCSNEIRLQIYNKNPYPVLLNLLQNKNINIVQDSITSINNILAAGFNTTPSTSVHPHFESISDIKGIEKLFSLFMRNVSERTKYLSGFCLGSIFRNREIIDPEMKKQLMSYIYPLINSNDTLTQNSAKKVFKGLILNKNVYTKDTAAICIGKLYKSQIIENAEMRKQIIMHIVILSRRTDGWSANAKSILVDLALNPINKAEIEKN